MFDAVIVSKHQKAKIIAPILAKLGIHLVEETGFDTDRLGTFSGEIERTLSPKECALAKAKKACELANCDVGIGSEGSFGGGPMPGFMNWNTEILCLYQKPSDTVIYAFAEGASKVDNLEVTDQETLQRKLSNFPGQHWIYRDGNNIHKGLTSDEVGYLFANKNILSTFKVEPDLRAMYCPERQSMIAKAAEDLARRLTSFCPQCGHVDFVVKDVEKGLPCELCQLPTNMVKAHVLQCDKCSHKALHPVESKSANPANCQFCNP